MDTQEYSGQLCQVRVANDELGFDVAEHQLQNLFPGYMDLMYDPHIAYQALDFDKEPLSGHSDQAQQLHIVNTYQTPEELDINDTPEPCTSIVNTCPSGRGFSEKLASAATSRTPGMSGSLEPPFLDYDDLPLISNPDSFNQWMPFDSIYFPLQKEFPGPTIVAASMPVYSGSSFLMDTEPPTTSIGLYNDLGLDHFDASSFSPLSSFSTSDFIGPSSAHPASSSISDWQWPNEMILPVRGYTANHTQVSYPQNVASLPFTYTNAPDMDLHNWNSSITSYQGDVLPPTPQSFAPVFLTSTETHENVTSDLQYYSANGPINPHNNADVEQGSQLIILDSSGNIDGKVAQVRKAKRARRSGHLGGEKRSKVANVRKVGACWYCRIRKIPCNVDNDRCQQCQQKVDVSSPMGVICRRESFTNFFEMFYCDYKTGDWEEFNVNQAIGCDVAGITPNKFEIKLECCSPKYPLIRQTVHEFVPSALNALEIPVGYRDGKLDLRNKYYTFELICDPVNTDWSLLKAEIRNFVGGSIEVGRDRENDIHVLALRPFSSQIMSLLESYSMKTPGDTLLKKAWTAFTYEFLLCKILTMTKQSEEEVKKGKLQPALHSGNQTNYSWYTMAQLKALTLAETRIAMTDLLVSLECHFKQEIKQRTKKGCLSALSALLMLCFMVENAETLMFDYVYEYNFIAFGNWELERAIGYMLQLETYIIDYAIEIFREIYHPLPKSKHSKGRYSKFNPIRDGMPVNISEGVTAEMSELVEDICKVIKENRREMEQRDRPPKFPKGPKEPTEEYLFSVGRQMSGRLLSRVLMWFL